MSPGVALALLLGAAGVAAAGRGRTAASWIALGATILGVAFMVTASPAETWLFGGLSFHVSAFASSALLAAALSLAATALASLAEERGSTGADGARHLLAALPLGLAAIAVCAMAAGTGASAAMGEVLPSDGGALAAAILAVAATAAVLAVGTRPEADRPPDGAASGPTPQASAAAAASEGAHPEIGGGTAAGLAENGQSGRLALIVAATAAAMLFVLGSSLAPRPGEGAGTDPSAAVPAFLLIAAGVGLRYGIVPLHRSTLRVLAEIPPALVPLVAAWLPAGLLLAALAWMESALDPVGAFLPEEVRIVIVLVAAAALAGGAVAAVRQAEMIRLIGCLLVSDGGIALLALAGGPEARETARTWAIVNAVARTALVAWWIALRASTAAHGRTSTSGWARHLPAAPGGTLVVLLAVVAAATVGLPGWMLFDARAVLVDLAAGWPLRVLPTLAAWAALAGFARIAIDAFREPAASAVAADVAPTAVPAPAFPRQLPPGASPRDGSPLRPATASVRLSPTGIRWSGESRSRTESLTAEIPAWNGGIDETAAGPGRATGEARRPSTAAMQSTWPDVRLDATADRVAATEGHVANGAVGRPAPRSNTTRSRAPGEVFREPLRLWDAHRAGIALAAATLAIILAALLSSAIVPLGQSGLAAAESPAPATEGIPSGTAVPGTTTAPAATVVP